LNEKRELKKVRSAIWKDIRVDVESANKSYAVVKRSHYSRQRRGSISCQLS